jgi:NADH-quinone oxidoreductase subunit L
MVDLIWLIPVLPLIGAALMLFIGKRLPKAAVNVICIGSVFLSFLLSAGAVLASPGQPHEVVLFQWLPLLNADVGFLLDPLSYGR